MRILELCLKFKFGKEKWIRTICPSVSLTSRPFTFLPLFLFLYVSSLHFLPSCLGPSFLCSQILLVSLAEPRPLTPFSILGSNIVLGITDISSLR